MAKWDSPQGRLSVHTAPIWALCLIYIRSYGWGSLVCHTDKCYRISGAKVSSDKCQAHNDFRISAQVSTCFPSHRFTPSLNAMCPHPRLHYLDQVSASLRHVLPREWGPAWTRQPLAHGPVHCISGGSKPARVSDDHTFGSSLCVFFLAF